MKHGEAVVVAVLGLAMFAGIARAQDAAARELLAQADVKMRDGQYDAAVELYEKAKAGAGSAAAYNRACALVKIGKVEEGEAALKDVVAHAVDAKVAGSAAFNLGRSLYSRGMAAPAQGAQGEDPTKSLALLRGAEGAFRAALDADAGDRDAARALELTRRAIQKIEQKMEEQKKKADEEQKQKDDERRQKQKDMSDKLKDLADRQKDAGDESKKAEDESKEQKPDAARQGEQAKKDQEGVSKDTSDAASQLDQQQKESGSKAGSEQAKDAQKKLDEAQREQQSAKDALKKNQFSKAQEHQQKAAEKLREAAEKLEEAAEQEGQEGEGEQKEGEDSKQRGEPKDGEKAGARPQAGKPKKPEDPLAARLLDREEQTRQARQQLIRSMRGKPTPVDRDW